MYYIAILAVISSQFQVMVAVMGVTLIVTVCGIFVFGVKCVQFRIVSGIPLRHS